MLYADGEAVDHLLDLENYATSAGAEESSWVLLHAPPKGKGKAKATGKGKGKATGKGPEIDISQMTQQQKQELLKKLQEQLDA